MLHGSPCQSRGMATFLLHVDGHIFLFDVICSRMPGPCPTDCPCHLFIAKAPQLIHCTFISYQTYHSHRLTNSYCHVVKWKGPHTSKHSCCWCDDSGGRNSDTHRFRRGNTSTHHRGLNRYQGRLWQRARGTYILPSSTGILNSIVVSTYTYIFTSYTDFLFVAHK